MAGPHFLLGFIRYGSNPSKLVADPDLSAASAFQASPEALHHLQRFLS